MPGKASDRGGTRVKLSAEFVRFLEGQFEKLGGPEFEEAYDVNRSTLESWKGKVRDANELWARRNVVVRVFRCQRDLNPGDSKLNLPTDTVDAINQKLALSSVRSSDEGSRLVAAVDLKSILHRAVHQYLQAEEPSRQQELDVVFDDVFLVIEGRLRKKQSESEPGGERGTPFDAGMLTGTIISTACWVGFALLTEASKYAANARLADVLDDAEDELEEGGVDSTMLHNMRTIIQGVCEERQSGRSRRE